MHITAISDLHGHYPKLEGGDLLIVAGDLTAHDRYHEYIYFTAWLKDQKYKKKIVICGNHDTAIEYHDIANGIFYEFEYLCDSGTEFEELKIWGSPWTRTFDGMNPKCKAFTVDTDEELKKKWDLIPEDTDILITHMPPYGIFDRVRSYVICDESYFDDHVGSQSLANMVLSNKFPNLKLHVFGHIHEWGGRTHDTVICKFVNASIMNEVYDPVNQPVRIEL